MLNIKHVSFPIITPSAPSDTTSVQWLDCSVGQCWAGCAKVGRVCLPVVVAGGLVSSSLWQVLKIRFGFTLPNYTC